MPGLYTVVSRAPGTLITALIYNFDHQQHVDGRSAPLMGSYGISSSQFQLTEDPLPGGVESLPPSMAGELTRLRFVMAQIKQQLQGDILGNWYDTLASPGAPISGARIDRVTSQTIANASGTPLSFAGGSANYNSGVWEGVIHPSRFTAPATGKYYAFVQGTWAAATGGRRQLQLGVNGVFDGTNAVISNTVPTTATVQPQAVTGLLNLAANDYVEFAAFQNTGGGLALTSVSGGIIQFGS